MSATGAAPVLLRIRAAIAPMHCEPRIASQMVSQALAGHVVELVDEEGEWVRSRGADDYEGWVHRGFLDAAPATTTVPESALVSLGCRAMNGASAARALPLRALLSPGERVVDGEALPLNAVAERYPLNGLAVARTAVEAFRGTSYLWGGVTPWGADCSGLVQCVFALHGLQLPRDAWQQAETGTPIDGGIAAARPGDLLFFSDREDGKVTHVGVAVGDQSMVHLSLGRGGYAVDDLRSPKDLYAERLRARFVGARRPIDR